MANAPISCQECHRRKQKCNRQTPCQHCIARGKEEACLPHEQHSRKQDVNGRLAAIEEELSRFRSIFEQLKRQGASILVEGEVEGRDSDVEGDLHTSEGESSLPLEVTQSVVKIGEDMERRQVGSVLDGLKKTRLIDMQQLPQLGAPPLFNQEQLSEIALQNHGIPKTSLSDLQSVLHPRHTCDALVSHFYTHINWIRQPWPRRNLCQSFSTFWASGPILTTKSINTFALLCSLCAIARLSIEHVDFDSDSDTRKLQARRFHYAARHALMLSSVFNREDLDQVIAWTLACRFLVLERRYGEAYTCAARAVKAAYSIDLHRDGSKQGMNSVITEARRKVWSAVYYFDRTISMLTGRPPVIEDRYCDVLPPSETGFMSDIYPLPATPPLHLIKEGEKLPTVFAYCAHRHAIAILQGRMVAVFLQVQGESNRSASRDQEITCINQDLQSIKSKLPTYLRVELRQKSNEKGKGGIICDKSFDRYYGFLPIQRFLLQSEISSLCIGLHRPFLLSTKDKDAVSLRTCLDAALLDIALYEDFMKEHGSTSQLELQVYVGSHRWFHSILICGIILLAHPQLGEERNLSSFLYDFVDKKEGGNDDESGLDPSHAREIEIVNLFIQGYQNRKRGQNNHRKRKKDSTQENSKTSKRHSSRHDIEEAENFQRSQISSPMTSTGDTSEFAAGQEQASDINTNAEHLLSTWYATGSNTSAWPPYPPDNVDTTEFSQVFDAFHMDAEVGLPPPSINMSPVGENSNLANNTNDWHGFVPMTSTEDTSPWSKDRTPSATALLKDPQSDYHPTMPSHGDSVDVDFWLNLIKKL